MLAEGSMLQERYRILRQIGGGGMGVVYLAEDTRLPGRCCAVKEMLAAHLVSEQRIWAADAFRQEARMLANLSHPGLATVTDFFSEEGNSYLVMDYVPGQTLGEMLESAPNGRLSQVQALLIVHQLCDVLGYLHSQDPPVIFRDLKPSNVMVMPERQVKPSNVMVTSERQVKLIDFGIARFFKPERTRDTVNMGTPGYAAPEQWDTSRQSDARSDIFALGRLLMRLVTGYDPVRNPWLVPHPREVMPQISLKIECLILRATLHEPEARYQSIAEFRHDLDTPVGQLRRHGKSDLLFETKSLVPAEMRSAPKRTGRWTMLGIAGGAFLGLCVGLIAWGIARPDLLTSFGIGTAGSNPNATQVSASTPELSSITPVSSPTTPTSSPTTKPIPSPSPSPYVVVSTEQLRIYAGPGENYDVVGEIHRGDRLPLCGRSADGMWWQVDYLGWQNWIHAQPAGTSSDPTFLPTSEAPPTPARTPTPTKTLTPTPGPRVLHLQNPGFEGIQGNSVPGWYWQAADDYSPGEDPNTTFDTPSFSQTSDPTRMINGATLQIEESFLKFQVHIFQTVSVSPTVTVRFHASAKAYSNVGGIKLAAGLDPDGNSDCRQARWGEMQTVNQSDGTVRVVSPDVAVGDAGRVTVCLFAETLYSARSSAAFFDDAVLIANPE